MTVNIGRLTYLTLSVQHGMVEIKNESEKMKAELQDFHQLKRSLASKYKANDENSLYYKILRNIERAQANKSASIYSILEEAKLYNKYSQNLKEYQSALNVINIAAIMDRFEVGEDRFRVEKIEKILAEIEHTIKSKEKKLLENNIQISSLEKKLWSDLKINRIKENKKSIRNASAGSKLKNFNRASLELQGQITKLNDQNWLVLGELNNLKYEYNLLKSNSQKLKTEFKESISKIEQSYEGKSQALQENFAHTFLAQDSKLARKLVNNVASKVDRKEESKIDSEEDKIEDENEDENEDGNEDKNEEDKTKKNH